MPEKISSSEQTKKNRKVILGIFGIPALIILLSSGLYYLVDSNVVELGTVNSGELLIPPLEFTKLPLSTISGETFDYSKPEPRWAFVVFGDFNCEHSCERMLYVARQSITALGNKMNNVRLIYVTKNGAISDILQEKFSREYIGMDVVAIDQQSIVELFIGSDLDPLLEKQFFVVDPRGWLMMQYRIETTDQETLNGLGKSVIKDMKRLIK